MPKDFNQSTSLESYLKLQWVYSNTSTIIIRTLYVSNINTDCVQLFDSLFHTPPRANYNNCNSVCSPRSIIHLWRQVKLIGKSSELHWEDYQLKTTLLFNNQFMRQRAYQCRDIEHAGSLESTKEAWRSKLPKCSISRHTHSCSMN